LNTPKARHGVENGAAFAVVYVTSIRVGDDTAAAQRVDGVMILLSREMMGDIETPQLRNIVVAQRHAGRLSSPSLVTMALKKSLSSMASACCGFDRTLQTTITTRSVGFI
jgi:hypothetical protein